jgi:molecular chaperone DnaK (HSP70)
MNARFSVGIDLGTSNSAIAVVDIESGDTKIVEIEQIVGPNQLGELPTLPSAIYVPHREEFPERSFPLPWNDAGEPAIVGQFARDRGALVVLDRRIIEKGYGKMFADSLDGGFVFSVSLDEMIGKIDEFFKNSK